MSHQSTTDHQEFSPEKLGISPITTTKVLAAISTKAIFWHAFAEILCGSADEQIVLGFQKMGVSACTQDLTKEHCPKPT